VTRIDQGNGSSGVVGGSIDLDVFGSIHGMILYRGTASWMTLAVGADGQVLTTHGAAADLTWETPASGGSGSGNSYMPGGWA